MPSGCRCCSSGWSQCGARLLCCERHGGVGCQVVRREMGSCRAAGRRWLAIGFPASVCMVQGLPVASGSAAHRLAVPSAGSWRTRTCCT